MWCWGHDVTAATGTVPEPTQVPGTWTSVSAGSETTCGITSDGALACWGANGNGAVGDGTHVNRPAPVTIGAPPWQRVSVGQTTACALDGAGALFCWGSSYNGLGDGSFARLVPTRIGDQTYSDVDVGIGAVVAVEAASQHLYCWGTNYHGTCGDGTESAIARPEQIGSLTWSNVVAGQQHTCGLSSDGLACWGDDYFGELGDGISGDFTHYATTPQLVTGPAGIETSRPVAGNSFSCSVADTGAAWCWGYNYNGELGYSGTFSGDPAELSGGPWRMLTAGAEHACGITMTGTLWCWGFNSRGQVGDGTTANAYKPLQVGTRTDWSVVAAGGDHTCALDTAANLWCWGSNDYGQCGIGVAEASYTPHLVPMP
jgi:alpha-tubulin suppressor-like RCC1 family protein